jgi:threonine aldolase
MMYEPQANIIFFEMPRREHKRMLDGGAVYYVMNGDPEAGDPDEPLIGRLVTDWSMTEDGVNQFLDLLRG